MRKEYYLYITLILIVLAGILYYLRPLPSHGLIDPGEAYFVVPERSLPSSWEILKKNYWHNSETTYEKEQLNSLDKMLQYRDPKTGEIISTYTKTTTGGITEEIYRDNVSTVFQSGDNKQVIQYHIDILTFSMSGYELYPPRLNFANAIPGFVGIQQIIRVGSLYSSLLCHEGKQELCTDNFRTLFKFSQQMKNSGTLISLLIGIVEEGIVINHIEYLTKSDPEQYKFLITMLKSQDYMTAEEALRNAFISEYNMVKNEINNISLNIMQSYDLISIIGNDEERDPTHLILGICRILRIPPKWLFDIPETVTLARGLYYQIIMNAIGENPGTQEVEVSSYRSSGHPLSRKNILGYHFLNALIPRLTGIHHRVLEREVQFNALINQ